jgi:hypothetical protein
MEDQNIQAARPATGVAPQEEELEQILQQMALSEADTDILRSLTRILVGGALLSWDELLAHLRLWEIRMQYIRARQQMARAGTPDLRRLATPPSSQADSTAETMRYALIGLLFESQNRFRKRTAEALGLADKTTGAFWKPLRDWMERSRLARPARSRLDSLIERGEMVVDQWVQEGREEEEHSRQLATVAAQETFSTSMDQLGRAPALQDLVRQQSAGLTKDVLDEVRERTVSADTVVEHVARSLLRRAPRTSLPAPSTAGQVDTDQV